RLNLKSLAPIVASNCRTLGAEIVVGRLGFSAAPGAGSSETPSPAGDESPESVDRRVRVGSNLAYALRRHAPRRQGPSCGPFGVLEQSGLGGDVSIITGTHHRQPHAS